LLKYGSDILALPTQEIGRFVRFAVCKSPEFQRIY